MFLLGGVVSIWATPYNIAHQARASASSSIDAEHDAAKAIDQVIRIPGKGEWVSKSTTTFWGQIDYPWIKLDWEQPVNINKVILYDRPVEEAHIAGGVLHFSDGSKINVWEIANDGSPKVVEFDAKRVEWIRFEVTDGDGNHLGLSEIEVYPSPQDYTDYISWVNPYIETARGRYFFFITGNQPFGMIGAAPLTRNKNQYGGGYNYNSTEVLGFPQIHCWMLSGLTVMPVTGNVDPRGGEDHWKSPFRHEGEIAQPGYHKLFLDKYKVWVEQTATDRVSFYRFTYTESEIAKILINLGGYVGTSTMVNAHVYKKDENRLEGYFDTTGRLWGGPDVVKIFFAVTFDTSFDVLNGWADQQQYKDISELQGTKESTARNRGMSYHYAPSSGIEANYQIQSGDQLQMKVAISYVSTDNAWENMEQDCNHWDFNQVRNQSQQEWNEWLGKIDVEGGTDAQRIKFYTDLWHTLLGRHKLDDYNGEYPDYTTGQRVGSDTKNAQLKVRQLPKDKAGRPIHHMYNSDAFWLTQWNLNTLWALAYPSVLDDFAACLIQYDANGGLLPRGPNAGGYSYIMTGCPATPLITAAFQKGITKKWDTAKGYNAMKRNHAIGGMQGLDMDKEFDFYIKKGYCPNNAGLTIQWAFEDWALSEMAKKMGKKKDQSYYYKRATGWPESFNKDLNLILPRKADGEWLHTDPMSGAGYIEANAWQATFGLSHDIGRLAEKMGGKEILSEKLNYAFEKSVDTDFVYGYGDGYVSYANQPGCSNAHVFSHVGKPWLTQYWVRRVKEQAYGATTPDRGYGGHDEDQGQMGGVSALMAVGLFEINGGSSVNPHYEITSPVFDKITIQLDNHYYPGKEFVIDTKNNSSENVYIQSVMLNGQPLNKFYFPHSEFIKGGKLEMIMGARPNQNWGVE